MLPALLDITISAKLEAKSFTISVYRIYTHKIYGSGISHRYNAKLVISRIVIARVYLIANSLAYDQKVVLILAEAMLPCDAPGLYSFRGSRGRIRCSEIAHNRCAHSIGPDSRLTMSATQLQPNHLAFRTYLHRQLGAKVSRKTCKFICLPICLRFGRHSPLGKTESHLQGTVPPYRGVLRGDTRTMLTCTLNIQQNSSIWGQPARVVSPFPKHVSLWALADLSLKVVRHIGRTLHRYAGHENCAVTLSTRID